MTATRDARQPLDVRPDTRIIEVLDRYGDVADVMEAFGVRRVGPYSVRRLLGRFVTVERAARLHGVALDDMLGMLRTAIARAHGGAEAGR